MQRGVEVRCEVEMQPDEAAIFENSSNSLLVDFIKSYKFQSSCFMYGYDGVNFDEELFCVLPHKLVSFNLQTSEIVSYDRICDDARRSAVETLITASVSSVQVLLSILGSIQEIFFRKDDSYIWNVYIVLRTAKVLSSVHADIVSVLNDIFPNGNYQYFEKYLEEFANYKVSMFGLSLSKHSQFELKLYLSSPGE